MEKLTHQEEEAMLIIWKAGEGVIKDYLEKYPEPQPPYTTLASIVKNLERKGYLWSKRYGNTSVYHPRVTEEEYKNKFLSGVVENYFANSYREMVTFFAKKQKISAKELKEIVHLIENENKA
jgi:BlaI family transcriptional regulator, penicillinase repressor